MGDFEGIKHEFDRCLVKKDFYGGLLFSHSDRFSTIEALAAYVLDSPLGLNEYVRWSSFILVADRYGFPLSRRDLENFSHYLSVGGIEYFNSPVYSILFYLANPVPQDFSLEQLL